MKKSRELITAEYKARPQNNQGKMRTKPSILFSLTHSSFPPFFFHPLSLFPEEGGVDDACLEVLSQLNLQVHSYEPIGWMIRSSSPYAIKETPHIFNINRISRY